MKILNEIRDKSPRKKTHLVIKITTESCAIRTLWLKNVSSIMLLQATSCYLHHAIQSVMCILTSAYTIWIQMVKISINMTWTSFIKIRGNQWVFLSCWYLMSISGFLNAIFSKELSVGGWNLLKIWRSLSLPSWTLLPDLTDWFGDKNAGSH